MITKRKLLTSTLALGMSAALFSGPAFSQGGSDPIPGIDIIIKKDPGSKPIKPASFGPKEIGLAPADGYEKLNEKIKKLVLITQKRNDMDTKYISEQKQVLSKKLYSNLMEGQGGEDIIVYERAGCCSISITIKITFGKGKK